MFRASVSSISSVANGLAGFIFSTSKSEPVQDKVKPQRAPSPPKGSPMKLLSPETNSSMKRNVMSYNYNSFDEEKSIVSNSIDSEETLTNNYNSGSTIINQDFNGDKRLPPIFMVDGFMSFSVFGIWGNLVTHFRQTAAQRNVPCPAMIHLASGGVASAHDNAVSLFYQIKGGIEDFGLHHSTLKNHDRFGLTHTAIYPEWSSDHPVHIIGHSFGGNVILELQRLLNSKFFVKDQTTGERYDTSADWLISCTFVSSPLRGSSATVVLGADPGQPNIINHFSVGRMLYFYTHLWEWLDYKDSKGGWWGVHFRMSHFGLNKDRSIFGLIGRLFGRQLFDDGLDNSSGDISLINNMVNPHVYSPACYYRSYAATMTRLDPTTKHEVAMPHWAPGLSDLSNRLGRFDMAVDGMGYLDQLARKQPMWRKNDGVCPLISQFHPHDQCHSNLCSHLDLPLPGKPSNFMTPSPLPSVLTKGVWYVSTIPDCSHVDLIPGFDPPHIPNVISKTIDLTQYAAAALDPSGIANTISQTIGTDPDLLVSINHYRKAFMTDYYQFISKINLTR